MNKLEYLDESVEWTREQYLYLLERARKRRAAELDGVLPPGNIRFWEISPSIREWFVKFYENSPEEGTDE